MNIWNKLTKVFGSKKQSEKAEIKKIAASPKSITLSPSSHTEEYTEYGTDDKKYICSFIINDAFTETKTNAGEIPVLYSCKCGEDDHVYIMVSFENSIYEAVEEYKKNGSLDNLSDLIELTPLNGNFYFKAKMEYDDDIMYFYALDRCDGFWENNGIGIIYPQEFLNTGIEQQLLKVLDETAESYKEVLIQ